MKTYSISSKAYVSINVPIDIHNTLIIPKKGSTITVMFDVIPEGLRTLADKNVIIMKEIK
jgi:hypothetical protein